MIRLSVPKAPKIFFWSTFSCVEGAEEKFDQAIVEAGPQLPAPNFARGGGGKGPGGGGGAAPSYGCQWLTRVTNWALGGRGLGMTNYKPPPPFPSNQPRLAADPCR